MNRGMLATVGDYVWVLFLGPGTHFNIWKVWLCWMKKSNKIWKKSEENRGMVLTIVGSDYGLVLFQGSVHISIYGGCIGSSTGWAFQAPIPRIPVLPFWVIGVWYILWTIPKSCTVYLSHQKLAWILSTFIWSRAESSTTMAKSKDGAQSTKSKSSTRTTAS